MWFDTRMGADESRIRELENGFRRDGLPNLIVDWSASEDIFTRAIPFLTLVFVVEIVNALDVDAGWTNLLLALGGAVVLFGAFGLLNVARGRPFLSIPHRVAIPELVAFVALPALLPVIFSAQFLFGLNTILVNSAILLVAYLVVGFGLDLHRAVDRGSPVRAAWCIGERARASRSPAPVLLAGHVLHDGDLAGVHAGRARDLLDGDGDVRAARHGIPQRAPARCRAGGAGRLLRRRRATSPTGATSTSRPWP